MLLLVLMVVLLAATLVVVVVATVVLLLLLLALALVADGPRAAPSATAATLPEAALRHLQRLPTGRKNSKENRQPAGRGLLVSRFTKQRTELIGVLSSRSRTTPEDARGDSAEGIFGGAVEVRRTALRRCTVPWSLHS
mmetsp:Transcript_19189/g.59607  ORF Transcript_19189/g.59607 Transcript_19189/m.59607 type:complete len:138 (-) Transcript_19189:26-439(-)